MMPTCRCARVRQVGKVFSNRNLGQIFITKKCFASSKLKLSHAVRVGDVYGKILVMEEEREGRWEGFCLDMEAQEAYGEVHLGSKSKAVTELQKRADRADQSVLIFPSWC